MSLNPAPQDTPGLRRRFVFVSLTATAVFVILALRLWHLQILSVDHYRELSERNRIRYVAIDPPRGTIYDRNGILLVDNRPAFTVSVLRQEIDDRELLFERVAALLDYEVEEIDKRWQSGQHLPRYQPLPLLVDVGRDAMDKVQENGVNLPGILVEVKPLRAYPHDEMAAHLFGYLGEITEDELRSNDFPGYRGGDMIGKTGLERLFEDKLRGIAGRKRIEVNVKGREMRQVTIREPLPGHRMYLTIDTVLQQAAEEAMTGQAGAVVALDVKSGEVLAYTSRPSFNPAAFARGITSEEWEELIGDSRHPMTNKAIRGQYPPGSTFKMAVALAALESGKVTPQTKHICTGSIKLSRSFEYRCWKKHGHGTVDLHKAIRESCDVWFYQVGLEIGIERIADAARRLGLGRVLGFPFGSERAGLIPDRNWKKQRFGTSWYDGETVIAAIGQGYVLTTPLQLASMVAAIANGGKVWRPQVVQRVETLDGEIIWESDTELLIDGNWNPAHLGAVRDGMAAVVNETGGTAWRSQLKNVRYAGKTGTAQVVKRKADDDEEEELEDIEYRFRDHALFVAYAPYDNPEVAVAVVVEHGGHGSSAAAPVAKAMFQAYFAKPDESLATDRRAAEGD